MQTKKRVLLIALILVSGFVLADYLEFFPTLYKDYAMNLPFTFEFIDAVDNTPVSGITVNASYNGADAISKYHDDGGNTAYVVIKGGGFGYKQTFLFKKPSPRRAIKQIAEKEIDFTFQRTGYKTITQTLSKGKRGEIYIIKLSPVQ
jgi:hypothetical protein